MKSLPDYRSWSRRRIRAASTPPLGSEFAWPARSGTPEECVPSKPNGQSPEVVSTSGDCLQRAAEFSCLNLLRG